MIRVEQKILLSLLPAVIYLASRWTMTAEAGDSAEKSRQPATIAAARHYLAIDRLIRRDPFAAAPRTKSTKTDVTSRDAMPPTDIEDVPVDPPAVTPEINVKATIVGSSPVAYVAIGNRLEIVRLGDRLGTHRIVEIDAMGLRFDDGSRFELVAHTASNASPPRQRTRVMLRLPSRRSARTPPADLPRPVSPQPAQPIATPQPSAQTAGALPTIKAGAFPLGSRPTSDPNAPTAFPYPYPYPAPR